MSTARPTRLPSRFGMHVSGADAWPRPDVSGPIIRRLARGDSAKMFGLRRIGKSSCMAAVREGLAGQALVVHTDAQNANTMSAFTKNLLGAVPEAAQGMGLKKRLAELAGLAQPIIQMFTAIRDGKPTASDPQAEATFLAYWSSFAPAIGQHLASQDRQVVICFDEFPLLCDKLAQGPGGVAAVNNILAQLREWRALGPRRLAMFFTGSVGFASIAKRRGLERNHLNDPPSIPLPPLPPGEARAFLRALIAGNVQPGQWTEAMVETFLQLLPETHAGVIQYAFQSMLDAEARNEEDIRHAFLTQVEPGLLRDFYTQFDDRLRDHGKETARRLRLGVKLVAAAPQGLPAADFLPGFIAAGEPEEETADVIAILEEDGFLRHDLTEEKLFLADGLVRAWWRRQAPFQ